MAINLSLLGRYSTSTFDASAAEISAYDPETQRLFVVNANIAEVEILDLRDPANPTFIETINADAITATNGKVTGVNSVAIKNGILAIAFEVVDEINNDQQLPGQLGFYNTNGTFLNAVEIGALPDMVKFTPDGTKVLVANEGEPNGDYTIDPEGSVSIVDISNGVENATAVLADFNAFDDQIDQLKADGVRIFGPNASVSQDLEPEYIAVDADSQTAYVALQENNAIAVLDLTTGQFTDIFPLGFKDHSLPDNEFDASDRDGAINIRNWPVFGMYQPDAIDIFEVGGQSFIITANEGDARDYKGFSEENRIKDLVLDPVAFPNFRELQLDENLGRLTISNVEGISDADVFIANLQGTQEVPEVTTNAKGDAVLRLNEEGTALSYNISLEGIDVGAFFGDPQTEATEDDLTGLHFHNGVRGENGPVAFGILSPTQQEDLVYEIQPDGSVTLTGAWKLSDPANISLAEFIDDLRNVGDGEEVPLYLNIHTNEFPSGEIRGQITETTAYRELYAYGGRSFSIFDTSGNLVFDSGSQFERITAEANSDFFNSNNDENSFETRSDDKGPEPEGVVVGEINGTPYGFIGFERVGGVAVYDLSDPTSPEFVQYINERDFTVDPQLADRSTNPAVGDLGPEGLIFISADDSPNGEPLLVVNSEVSGTTSVFEVEVPPSAFTLQLLHAGDQEGGLSALQDAVNFSAVMEGLANDFANTLRLSSGDIYIPGPFFNASNEIYGSDEIDGTGIGDILINNALGFQAVAFGNHEFDQGTEVIRNLIAANPDITGPGVGAEGYQGTAFPYLSSNLDFSNDTNLADLVVPAGQAPQPNSITKSVVIDVNGESIGVVGATTPILDIISSPGDVGVFPENGNDLAALAAIIQTEVDTLTAQGIDKVVLLSHFQQIDLERQVAELLTDVDIVMAGGSNTLLANDDDPLRSGDNAAGTYPIELTSASGEPIALINTDGNYKYVGRLALEFDANGLITNILEESGAYATDQAGIERLYGEGANAAEFANQTIVDVTTAIGDLTIEKDGNVFGITEVFLNGTRGDVRTEETNLGNLTADANLFYAKQFDETVTVSIKNGGGIRDNIGASFIPAGGTSDELTFSPPLANPIAGKEEGQISQLDIENSLRFNNKLTLLTVTAEELERIVEYAVSATASGVTPGQFPQIGGMQFSFDPDKQAIELAEDGTVITDGERVQNLVITGNDGEEIIIVQDGELVADPNQEIRLVTLNFLAGGGDGYPFDVYGENRVDLVDESLTDDIPNQAQFTDSGSEQDALAEYLAANFPVDDDPTTPIFSAADVGPAGDTRIQNLSVREDTVISNPSPAIVEIIFNITENNFIDSFAYDTTPFAVGTNINTTLADDVQNLETDAEFRNLVGLYEVVNAEGQINVDTNGDGVGDTLINPNTDGSYARAAIENRVDNFKILAGGSGDPNFNTTAEGFGDILLNGGKFYAPFVIANGGNVGFDGFIANEEAESSQFNNAAEFREDLVTYFAFIGANPDNVEHLQSRGNGVFGFEDLPSNLGISDNDFNDAVFQLDFAA